MPRNVRLHSFGGPENLSVDEVPARHPGPGQARLLVEAAALSADNFRYMGGELFRAHTWVEPELPARLGYEVCGVVNEIGEGVDSSWVGKRVSPVGPFDQELYGSLGEEGIVPAELLWETPAGLSSEQGAAFWIPFLTAYGLVQYGHLSAGQWVAVPAATSAVGAAALQIIRDAGARSIATTRTEAKREDLLRLGADEVIVTGDEDYVERVREITGKGVDLTFDPISGPFLTTAAEASAPYATILEYGRMAGEPATYPLVHAVGKGLTITGFAVSQISLNSQIRETAARYVSDRLADGRFTPAIADTFPMDEVVAAYGAVRANRQIGRVVVTIGR